MAARFWVGGTGTWDGATTTHWSASTGGAGGASVPGSSDDVTFDGSSGGGTVTVNTNPSIVSLTMGAFTGTLDFATNNNNITISSGNALNISGTGTRTLNMGSGTWTFTAVDTGFSQAIAASTLTNMTLNVNTSTVLFSAVATGIRQINSGSLTGAFALNNVTVTNAAPSPFAIYFRNNFSCANLTLTNLLGVEIACNAVVTVSGTVTWAGGSSATSVAIFNTDGVVGSGAGTLNLANAWTPAWIVFQNITKAGAGSIVASNALNGGGNVGITINAPSSGGSSSILGS